MVLSQKYCHISNKCMVIIELPKIINMAVLFIKYKSYQTDQEVTYNYHKNLVSYRCKVVKFMMYVR